MKKLLLSVFALFIFAGCGSSDEPKTAVCTGPFEGMDHKTELHATGDDVKSMKMEMVMDLAEFGISPSQANEESKEAAKEAMQKEIDEMIGEMEGVIIEYDVSDEAISIILSIDFEKADLKKLQDANLVGSGSSEQMSFEKSIESFKKQGMTCTE